MTPQKIQIDTPWHTLAEAVAYSRRSRDQLLKALKTGELKGHQPQPGGSWTIHRDALDAWNRGELADVQPQPISRRRSA